MRKQQRIWLEEHTSRAALPTMANAKAASGVISFIEWLQSHNIHAAGTAVDIGSGKGRNSVYLAENGYTVWALDYIKPALDAAKELASKQNVAGKIHFICSEVDKNWNIDDNFFDIAIDSFTSIDIETRRGRGICRDEMFRTLKPNGYALVTVVSSEDEWEKEQIANSPGLEPNSTLWPENGKFQKNYDENELREFYKIFEIVDLRKVSKPTYKLGRQGTATNFWMVLRKK